MVADTYSNTLGFLIMGTGNDNNTWGTNANSSVFQVLEDAISNALTSSVTGGTLDLSGSPPPAAASQVRYAALIFTGTLGSNQIIQVPNLTKFWWVQNATAGASTLKIKTPAGSESTAIPQNSGWQLVECDGANGIMVSPFNTKQIQMPDGTAALPAYSNINEPSSGWYRAGTQDWRLSIGGVAVLQVTGAGASSPSVVNILSPNTLQVAGAQFLPPGTELAYAGVLLPSGGFLWEDGSLYSRTGSTANLFAAITATLTGTTHTNTTVDSLSVDLTNYGLVGAFVEGTGVQIGTTIVSITATSMVITPAATASAAGVSLRILPWGQGDASTTFNVPDRRERTLFGRGGMNGTVSPGRITLYDATRLNIGLGAESFTVGQANLPNVSFANSGITIGAPTGTAPIQQVSTNVAGGVTPTMIAGGTTSLSINAPSVTSQGSAASGGSGTAIKKIDPGGVCNYIIKT